MGHQSTFWGHQSQNKSEASEKCLAIKNKT